VFVGLATAFVQAVLVQRLVPRYGEKRMAMIALFGTAFGWLCLMAAPALWMLFPIAFLQAGITGFIWSTTGVLAANRVPEQEQGQLAGVNVALAGLMSMLGPLWAGAAYDHVTANAPYWMGSLIVAVALLFFGMVRGAVSESRASETSFAANISDKAMGD
jgi:MFS family permease